MRAKRQRPARVVYYLDVISKVVPKICARTNSAILSSFREPVLNCDLKRRRREGGGSGTDVERDVWGPDEEESRADNFGGLGA